MTGGLSSTTNGSRRPDRSQSRFLCNTARKISLVFFVIAFAALVIGGGFAEISTNGSPTSLETAIVRWTILGSVVIGVAAYVIGGRMREGQEGEARQAPPSHASLASCWWDVVWLDEVVVISRVTSRLY